MVGDRISMQNPLRKAWLKLCHRRMSMSLLLLSFAIASCIMLRLSCFASVISEHSTFSKVHRVKLEDPDVQHTIQTNHLDAYQNKIQCW
jgi:hypothetical protein